MYIMKIEFIKSQIERYVKLVLSILILYLASCSGNNDAETIKGNNIVFGKIIDAKNGMPLQGVSVLLYPGGNNYITGADGMYQFNNLTNDTYIIQVKKQNYHSKVGHIYYNEGNKNAHLDFSMNSGENSLDVLFGSMNFEESSSSKSFIITNIGSKSIDWRLHTDYNNILHFDKTEGTLAPNKSTAVTVDIILNKIGGNIQSFPVYISTANERTAIIATINDKSLLNNSLLVGDWFVESKTFFETGNNNRTYNTHKKPAIFLSIYDNYTYQFYEHQFINNGIDDADAMFSYNFTEGEYHYDAAKNTIQFDEYGSVYKINNLSKKYLELEQIMIDNDTGGEIVIYKRK